MEYFKSCQAGLFMFKLVLLGSNFNNMVVGVYWWMLIVCQIKF